MKKTGFLTRLGMSSVLLVSAMYPSVSALAATEKSGALKVANVKIENKKTGDTDSIQVSELEEGDIIKVYSTLTAKTEMIDSTVQSNEKSAIIAKKDLLDSKGGKVYVTVTKVNKEESVRTEVSYKAEPITKAPTAKNITVTNNKADVADTVKVTGVKAGDTVRVYDAATKGNQLGEDVEVGEGKEEAVVTIKQIAKSAKATGNVYVSVQGKDELESERTEKAYDAETTVAPEASNIKVVNNKTGAEDTITVKKVEAGDVVNVYKDGKTTEVAATATVAAETTEVVISKEDLLTSTGGKAYVTVTKANKEESARTEVSYGAEPTTKAPAAKNITVTNNKADVADTVKVTGVKAGDTVRVYDAATKGNQLGEDVEVGEGKEEAVVTIKQIAKSAKATGNVYVSVQGKDELESERTEKAYDAETTVAPEASNIKVVNNKTGAEDTITVKKVEAGDVVNVYKDGKTTEVAATATVAAETTEVVISKEDLLTSTGGKAYVTVTKANKEESARTEVSYGAEPTTKAPAAKNITVTNNKADVADTVKVTGVKAGDTVRVYDAATKGNQLGEDVEVGEGKEEAVVTIKQIAKSAKATGNVYVSVQGKDELESERTEKAYDAETTVAPEASNIKVVNNKTGAEDTITVKKVEAGDVVNVYKDGKTTEVAATATVAAETTEVVISKEDLLTSTGGKAYVTVTKANKEESARTEVSYGAEPTTKAPAAKNITVINNKEGIKDTVKVTGLKVGDKVRVYGVATKGDVLGEVTVKAPEKETPAEGVEETAVEGTEETSAKGVEKVAAAEGAEETPVTTLEAIVEIDQIAKSAKATGNVYVSVQGKDELESERTEKVYDAETTIAPKTDNIVVLNNDGEADVVRVTGLKVGDVVKVYDAAKEGKQIGTATVGDNKTAVNVKIDQLGTAAGKVYITITAINKLESEMVVKDYIAE